MSVQFILGGSGRGKTYYLQHFIAEEAELFPDRRYFYVVPEQFTMQTQKELIELSEKKGILNIEVQSFVRLAFRVFSETGAGHMPVLDDMGKTMILKKILSELSGELSYFGKNVHKIGYVQEIKSFLSELYQYNVTEEELEEMAEKAGTRMVLVKKLRDMQVIYRKFSEYLREHYITSEEVMNVLARVTDESELLKNSIVCLDGFTGFTPTQYEFLKRLILVARKVYVTVTIDPEVSIVKPGEKHGLFYLSQKTLFRIRKLAGEAGVEVRQEIWTGKEESQSRFQDVPELSFLEKELFRFPMKKFEEVPEHLSVHILNRPEDEMDFVAERIRKLLYEGACRYRDIAVITGDLQTYGMFAQDKLGKLGLPYFIDRKKGLEEQPFVRYILSAIDVILTDFAAEKVMEFVKNLFSDATDCQTGLLDNFLRATGIRGRKRWQEVWDGSILFSDTAGNAEQHREAMQEKLLMLDMVRLETVETLEHLYQKAIGKGRHTVREFSTAFCEWMQEEGLYRKLQKQRECFEKAGETELAFEYKQVYEIVLGVFDNLVKLLGEEQMNLKEFKEILNVGFSEAKVGFIPPGTDQILIGDMNRSRLSDVKHLFFIGMNDEYISQSKGKGGVISDAERQFLSDEEFELAPTLREQIYTEQFYLYLSLTKPSGHLYLTYAQTGTDGKAKKPAYILDRMKKMFPRLVPVVEENRADDSSLLGNFFGRDYLVEGLRNKSFASDKWQEVMRFYLEDPQRKDKLNAWIHAAFYREIQTKLSAKIVHGLYHKVLSGSTSQFEQYAACAFAYYMRYGLRLKERKEHQVAFFDIGNIAHAALENYTKKMLEEGKNWTDYDEETREKQADLCVEEAAGNYKSGLLSETERDSYLIHRLKRIVRKSVWAITKQMEQGEFQTVQSEFGFEILERSHGNALSEKMDKESDELLRLIGRVDRIDRMTADEKEYIQIVDYKTGRKKISLSDLYHGLQMQLMIYLKAGLDKAERRTKKIVIPAGIFYYHIDDPVLQRKPGEKKEETELRILKELRMNGLLNEDDPILPSFDRRFVSEGNGLPPKTDSFVGPFGTTSKGTLKSSSNTIRTEDFERLLTYTEEKLDQMKDEILTGNIAAQPYRKGNDKACTYCPYQGICRFDIRIPGNEYRDLEEFSTDEVLQIISDKNGGFHELDRGSAGSN